jgi:uncharacterized delta-60 repeat protein
VVAQQPVTTGNTIVFGFTNTGVLDNTFGVGGVATIPTSGQIPTTMLLQPDNKILVTTTTSGGVSRIYRLNADGSIDTSFGSSGSSLIASPDAGAPIIFGINTSVDGKIILSGWLAGVGNDRALISRYSANGTLDTAFGTNGFTFVGPGTDGNRAVSVDVVADGSLLISGNAEFTSSNEVFLTQISSAGTVDTGFGVNGYVRYTGVSGSIFPVVTLQPDQRILFGYATDRVNIHRLNANGSPDATFGANGLITLPVTICLVS